MINRRISRGVAEVRGLVMRGAKHPGITGDYRRIERALIEVSCAHEHGHRVFAQPSTVNTWEWALMNSVGRALGYLRIPQDDAHGARVA